MTYLKIFWSLNNIIIHRDIFCRRQLHDKMMPGVHMYGGEVLEQDNPLDNSLCFIDCTMIEIYQSETLSYNKPAACSGCK